MEKSSKMSRHELVLLAPVLVNIFLFHVFLDPPACRLAAIVNALEIYLALEYRAAFAELLT